jgi:hypothetical protein
MPRAATGRIFDGSTGSFANSIASIGIELLQLILSPLHSFIARHWHASPLCLEETYNERVTETSGTDKNEEMVKQFSQSPGR